MGTRAAVRRARAHCCLGLLCISDRSDRKCGPEPGSDLCYEMQASGPEPLRWMPTPQLRPYWCLLTALSYSTPSWSTLKLLQKKCGRNPDGIDIHSGAFFVLVHLQLFRAGPRRNERSRFVLANKMNGYILNGEARVVDQFKDRLFAIT